MSETEYISDAAESATSWEEGEVRPSGKDGYVEEEQVPFKIRTLTVNSDLRMRILEDESGEKQLSLSADNFTLPLADFKQYLDELAEDEPADEVEDQTRALEEAREKEFETVSLMVAGGSAIAIAAIVYGWFLAIGTGSVACGC